MIIDELRGKIIKYAAAQAMVWKDICYSYHDINVLIEKYSLVIKDRRMAGESVAIIGDYSPYTVALFIALLQHGCVVLPLSNRSEYTVSEFCKVVELQHSIQFESDGKLIYSKIGHVQMNDLMIKFRKKNHPGVVIFSSGSTGVSKAILHDAFPLLEKFRVNRKCVRAISFLLFDHIGGINTLFYTLFNGGCLVIPDDRSVIAVCQAIERHKVEALTTTPTFLNLLLLSQSTDSYCLESLRVINYGTEIMPEFLLLKLHDLFPEVRLSQAYGLSEVGVLPVRSISPTSSLIKIDESDEFNIRICNGMLEVKSKSSMVGYLNCENTMADGGWFKTGDLVEEYGDCLKILGRKSDIINVGGSKVYPAEVENVLRQIDNVEDVLVFPISNLITGNIVAAKFRLSEPEDLMSFHGRMIKFCKPKLSNYKIPQKIDFTSDIFHGERFKKTRITGVI